ncbi:trypsin-like peptidase domain-containing protein [Paenibacillus doosanensis]|uniref:S1C family serine protease n=1 Tax=Paenibacillus doosanensis TaxID=1229154 RepID=UPI00217FCE44|nr:trypsin-like peptidase domain-containing protein [Paenibacillus doosanensis]MCS7462759.1 trypsin-like peptidase domain-containing protein [Paenibacillus doosanensis]
MEDNKKGYDDFFRRPEGDSSNDTSSREAAGNSDRGEGQEKPSYYYSYGPYKSSMNQDETNAHITSTTGSGEPVEVTPPRPVRPFSYNVSDGGGDDPMKNWQFPQQKKRGSSFRSGFIAFLAGAVVVGGLMFASDKMNLFTGSKGVLGSTAAPSSSQSSSGGTAKPTSFSLGRPDNIAQIAEQSGPAVVKIETKVKTKASSGNSLFDDPFFRQFFGGNGGGQQRQKSQDTEQLQPGGMGTGFIFEKSGYILTNEHVIDGAAEIWVTVQGYDQPFKAQLLGNSYDLDLAALKIEPQDGKEFASLPLGKAEDTNVGDWVVAIGNPYGFDHTVTVGVLSAKERPISIPDSQGTREYKHLLQTDASINPGNSGGPLLNLNGEVIGINTAVSAQAQGIGFAIPTSTISSVLDNLKNNVKIPKEPSPYIGVQLGAIDKEWVSELKLENTDGAIVSDVERKSPAFKAGIRPYDVIVEVNGTKVKTSQEVVDKIKALKVNDQATLGVMRDGKKESITVTIGDRNAEADNTGK